MTIIIAIFLLIISFYFLAILTDEFFVDSLDKISHKLKLSSDVAGATFMAVGSSAPELFTSLIAVLKPGEHGDIGAGTIVGSAIFNILVIIGASALFRKAHLNWQPVIRDTLFYCLSIILLLFTFSDGKILIQEALMFIAVYVAYIVAVINWKKIFPYKDKDAIEIMEKETKKSKISQISKQFLGLFIPDCQKKPKLFIVTFLMSVLSIAFLSYILVESAIAISNVLHINPAIIALTVLAAGTSIPDLLASIAVAKQGRGDMAISNAIGSNIFDILFGLGIPWTIVLVFQHKPVYVSNENLSSSIILLFATVLMVFFLIAVRKWTIGRWAGLLLIGTYFAYLAWNILQVI